MMRRFLLSLLLGLGSLAGAQSIPLLPRVPVADSSLFLCTDSTKTVTRACKFSLVQQRMALKPFDSLKATNIVRAGAGTLAAPSFGFSSSTSGIFLGEGGATDTVAIGLNGTGKFRFIASGIVSNSNPFGLYAGDLTSSAGLQVRSSSGIGVAQMPNFGDASNPSLYWATGTKSGFYQVGSDSIGFSIGQTRSLVVAGGASTALVGGAGNMTILAGTGNSRTTTLQTTTSTGTAKNTLVLGADTTVTALGRIYTSHKGYSPSIAFGATNTGFSSVNGSDTVYFSMGGTEVGRFMPAAWWTGNGGTAAQPSIANSSRKTSGLYWTNTGGDTVGVSVTGVSRLRIADFASGTLLMGGTGGNMRIIAGTGNDRQISLQGTTPAGSAQTGLTIFGDSVKASQQFSASSGFFTSVGSVTNPSMSFEIEKGLGWYRSASGTVSLTQGSTERVAFSGSGMSGKWTGGITNQATSNGTMLLSVSNLSTGASGNAQIYAENSTGNKVQASMYSTGSTAANIFGQAPAGKAFITATGSVLGIGTEGAQSLILGTNNTAAITINSSQAVSMGALTVSSCTGCGGGGSSPVLDSQITGSGINSTGTNTTLFSYTIPAGTLTANGQSIEVYWNVQCFQGEANDQMRILVGSFTHTFTQGTSGAGGINTTRITRVDATHVNIETVSINFANTSTTTGRTINGVVSDLGSNGLALSVAAGGTTVGVCTGWQMTTRKLY